MDAKTTRVPSQRASVSRRDFLRAGLTTSAAMFAGGLQPAFAAGDAKAALADDAAWLERSIPELQAMMDAGALSSIELTLGYLRRIAKLDPLLNAVIETNPNAVSLAAASDVERRLRRRPRGPLHGIPILIKDNIATDDRMQTTSGSLALVNSRVPADATVAARLRSAGAIILGKANLGEWANFRGFNPFGFYGWSARGGATHNPYLLDYTAFGSSSGSAVGAAANLCAAAVGTETDGSIIGPSNANLVVGLKPTLGLVSQRGIVPISREQDTAGPIGRTVTDIAALLGVLQSPFGAVAGRSLPADYTRFLRRGALAGTRIGVDRRYYDAYDVYGFPGDADTLPFFDAAVATMAALGATVVDTDTGDVLGYTGDEFTALLFEFKAHLESYLATLSHTRVRTLGDLIAFNVDRCSVEMRYYGQELFELSEATGGDLANPDYVAARARARAMARAGIDGALAAGDLDAIVAPHLSNSTAPAVSGYPNLALPIGITAGGKPAGMLMYGGFLEEPTLLALAYDLEQALDARQPPQFLGSVEDPPEAGLCSTSAAKGSAAARGRSARGVW